MSRKPTPVGAVAAPAAPPATQADTEDQAPAVVQETTPEQPAAPPATQADPSDLVEVRVLRDEAGHGPNDVIHLSADEAMAAVLSGWADDDPAAVAAARAIAAE